MPASPEQTVEETPAFFCLGLFRFVVLIHGVSLLGPRYRSEPDCDLLSAIRAWMS